MNKLFTIVMLVFGAVVMHAQVNPMTATAPTSGPKLVWDKTTVEYGEIKKNSDPLRKATFTNQGTEPLVIKNARGSCGCTVPTWPQEPIMPGEQGSLEVRYSTDRVGQINKTITVETNETGVAHTLFVKGNVLAEEDESVPKAQPNVLGTSPK